MTDKYNACMNMDCIHYDSGELQPKDMFCPVCETETVYNLALRLAQERQEEVKRLMEEGRRSANHPQSPEATAPSTGGSLGD